MTKKELLEILKKRTYCRIQKSKIHGVGVFAIRNIPRGVDPFKGALNVRWHGFTKRDLGKLPPGVLKLVYDFFAIQDNRIWIAETGLVGMDMSFYMNSSKNPNIKTINDGDDFRTMRKINTREELTVDYDTFSQRQF